MQHKQTILRSGMIKLGVGVVFAAIIVFLMTAHVAAPQHAIEKELDAKVFLEQKQ